MDSVSRSAHYLRGYHHKAGAGTAGRAGTFCQAFAVLLPIAFRSGGAGSRQVARLRIGGLYRAAVSFQGASRRAVLFPGARVTVEQLKAALANLPDDWEVIARCTWEDEAPSSNVFVIRSVSRDLDHDSADEFAALECDQDYDAD